MGEGRADCNGNVIEKMKIISIEDECLLAGIEYSFVIASKNFILKFFVHLWMTTKL